MFTTARIRCLWVLAACALALSAQAAEKEATPEKSITVDLGGGVKMNLVLIPAGSFSMGSDKGAAAKDEKPVHEVTITEPFYMGKYEVTQEQWQAVMRNNPSRFKGVEKPVECVSWDDIQGFLQKLNARAGGGFALPTEAQWEHACRAGSKTAFCFGDDEKRLREYAWYADNSRTRQVSRTTTVRMGETQPVGEKRPNAWGLHDMHGNVEEWCRDWYGPYGAGAQTDPPGPANGTLRVLRGGSWSSGARSHRSAARLRGPSLFRNAFNGFRLIRLAAGH